MSGLRLQKVGFFKGDVDIASLECLSFPKKSSLLGFGETLFRALPNFAHRDFTNRTSPTLPWSIASSTLVPFMALLYRLSLMLDIR